MAKTTLLKIKRGVLMKSKKVPINILFTPEMNEEISAIADAFGISKSKTVRKMCLEYMEHRNVIKNNEIKFCAEYHL
jgi:hypothetical protein